MTNMLNLESPFPEKYFGQIRVRPPPTTVPQDGGAGETQGPVFTWWRQTKPKPPLSTPTLSSGKTTDAQEQLNVVKATANMDLTAPKQWLQKNSPLSKHGSVCHSKWENGWELGFLLHRDFVSFLFVVWVGFEWMSVLMSPNGHHGGNSTTPYLIGSWRELNEVSKPRDPHRAWHRVNTQVVAADGGGGWNHLK